jgi:hypothetical protein
MCLSTRAYIDFIKTLSIQISKCPLACMQPGTEAAGGAMGGSSPLLLCVPLKKEEGRREKREKMEGEGKEGA